MDELKKQAAAIMLKHGEAAAKELCVLVVFPALKAAVAASSSKIDDMVLGALEQPMKDAVEAFLTQISKE